MFATKCKNKVVLLYVARAASPAFRGARYRNEASRRMAPSHRVFVFCTTLPKTPSRLPSSCFFLIIDYILLDILTVLATIRDSKAISFDICLRRPIYFVREGEPNLRFHPPSLPLSPFPLPPLPPHTISPSDTDSPVLSFSLSIRPSITTIWAKLPEHCAFKLPYSITTMQQGAKRKDVSHSIRCV